MEERSLGIVIAFAGATAAVIAALANPIGLGKTEVFGWLQWTGVIVGVVVALLGLAMAAEWVPYPGRRSGRAGGASSQTTVVKD